MKLSLLTIPKILKEALWDDKIDRYLFFSSLLLFAVAFTIWNSIIVPKNIPIYSRFDIYPIRLLLIIFLLNSILAIFSEKKEKEISYLLFIANLISVILVLILEFFYLINY